MGKCVSKHPSLLTIAISEKDLATANQIWSKFAESTEYIALKDEHGNQLCEYYYVSKNVGCGHNEQEQYEQASQQNQQQQEEWQQQSQILQTSKKNKSSQLTTTEIYNVAANAFNSKMVDGCELTEQRQRYAAPLQTANHVVDVNNTNHSSTNRLNAEQHGLPLLRLLQTQKQKHQQHEQHHQHQQHQQHQQHLEHKEQQKHQTQLQQQQQQQHELQVQQINAESKTLEIVAVADAESNANIQHSNVVGVKNDKNSKNRNKQKFHNFKYSTIFGKSNVRDAKVLDWLTYDYEYGYVDVNSPQPHVEQVNCVFIYEDNEEGQTESKKSKKHGAGSIETKGTAMSFGFRKKLNTTPKKLKKLIEGDSKKKHDKCNNISDDDVGRTTGAVIDTEIIVTNENIHEDDNGNSDTMPKVYFEKMGAAAAGGKSAQKFSTNQGVPEQSQTANRPGAGNRFGYRGCNVARPASTGITGRYRSDSHENVENNNCTVTEGGQQKPLVSNLKRRSKSAHAGRALTSNQSEEQEEGSADAAPKITQPKTLTFNLNQNSTIEYQRQQFFQQPTHSANGRAGYMSTAQYQQHQPRVINTGMHTNVILRPTPRAPPATYSKFTLHTVSLPKPEFPVAISVSATTPTTPGSVFSPSPVTATALGSAGARAKDAIVYRVTHPLTAVQTQQHMDQKTAKQMANTTRRGFTGSREISADSGIASMDMALDSSTSSAGGNGGGRHSSPKRSRSRPRNLQMVMNGRHKFEVRDLDDPLSSESSSIVEPLALPKLPAENQTVPLPLSGLIRSNTVLSRESYERKNVSGQRVELEKPKSTSRAIRHEIQRNPSEESESVDEEKLYLDRSASEKSAKLFKDINTCSSKTSSPGSSIMSSWCNAGESLAVKDCSSLSISSSEDSNKVQERLDERKQKAEAELQLELNDDDISMLNTEMQISTISSLTETVPNAAQMLNNSKEENLEDQTMLDDLPKTESTEHILNLNERPKSLYDALNESKFAELALAGSAFLLDDETSPTDSLVSSTESEDAVCKQKKHKINEELQEKDIDEISPEFEVGSPISPGTPTHASHSLSLSDCGNLIDDEIADQPALLFNSEHQDGGDSLASRKDKTDTPTLMETGSMRSLKSQSKARTALQQAIELSLRTPLSLRKAVMERAESLDTLSPCESICSDDLMMDFDMNSSLDSIDRSASIRSRSGSDLNKIGESELFPELSRKSSDVMKELNTILKVHNNKNKEKDSIIAHLPARATRLLNRSRLQQQCPISNADSDSSKSAHSVRRSVAASRASSASTASNASLHRNTHLHQRDSHSSSDDLMLYDKSFRNAMIQEVLQFKKQLLRLRRILQEDEDGLTRTETLNPFETDNGQLFASCGLDSKLLDDIDLASLTSSTTDDPLQELADLRRQVVYLQGQVDDRDRTIRLQRNLIEKLEAEKAAGPNAKTDITKECINTATQTERTRPLAIGTENLSRSKPEYHSYTTHFPAICNDSTTVIQHQQQYPGNSNALNQTRRHTIISTTLTNYNHQQMGCQAPRRASIAWEQQQPEEQSAQTPNLIPKTYKPVRITLIGEPLKQWNGLNSSLNGEGKYMKNINGSHAELENKKNLLNGSKEFVNGNSTNNINSSKCNSNNNKISIDSPFNGTSSCKQNGYHNSSAVIAGNGLKQTTLQMENIVNNTQQHYHHHQQQQQQLQQQKQQQINGNLYPTVTIV